MGLSLRRSFIRKAETPRPKRQVDPRRGSQLVLDPRDVHGCRLRADEQGIGDLAIRSSLADQCEDLHLAGGQVVDRPGVHGCLPSRRVDRRQGKDPLDAFIDLAVEENLDTVFSLGEINMDTEAVAQILGSPYAVVGP